MLLHVIVFFIFLIFPYSVKAEEIFTKDGRVYRGEIIAKDQNKLRLNLGCGSFAVVRTGDIEKINKEPLEETLLYLGNTEVARGQINRGVQTLKRALALAPESPKIIASLSKAQVRLAAEKLERKQPTAARQLLLETQNLTPQSATVTRFFDRIEKILKKLDDLEKKARTAYTRGRWSEAQGLFQKLLETDLSRASRVKEPYSECFVALGDEALLEKEWWIARDYYTQALIQNPDLIDWIQERWVTAHLNPVHGLLGDGATQAALDEINFVLETVPDNTNALYFQGIAQLQLKKAKEAQLSFNQILSNNQQEILESLSEAQKKAHSYFKTSFELISLDQIKERWQESLEGDWQTIEGENWVLHHHSPWIANQLRFVIDDSLLRITQELTGSNQVPKLDPPIHIYIFRTEEEYLEASKMSGWTAGVTRNSQVNGQIVKREVMSFQTSPQLVRSVIPHELVHALLPELIDKNQSLPHWLNEGLAVGFEPDFKQSYYENLISQNSAGGSLIPLEQLISMTDYPKEEEKVKLFYAQSFGLVDFLIKEHGSKAFLNWAQFITAQNSSKKLESWIGDLTTLEESLFGK